MMKDSYQEMVRSVSEQVAKKFLENESDLAKRALFLDADIAEITRKIGLEATKIIYENTQNQLIKKKVRRLSDSKEARD